MAAVPPLTTLSDDERLFQDSVYEFADREIRPLVRDMDEHAKIPRSLIDKLFGLGIMAIEIGGFHSRCLRSVGGWLRQRCVCPVDTGDTRRAPCEPRAPREPR